MKTETIKAIFTNLLFVIGVLLMVFGFINGALTVTRSLVFDKYPLNSYDETRCNLEYLSYAPVATDVKAPQMSDADIAVKEQDCKIALEHERKVKQTEDIVTSIATLVVGTAIAATFRRFIFK